MSWWGGLACWLPEGWGAAGGGGAAEGEARGCHHDAPVAPSKTHRHNMLPSMAVIGRCNWTGAEFGGAML